MRHVVNVIKIFSSFFGLLLILGLSGCQVIQKIDSFNGILDEAPPDPEISRLLDAEYAFFAENFKLAEDIYLEVKRESNNALYVNSALYGLACITIATAKDIETLKGGYAMLQQWQEPGAEVVRFEENPRMIATALNRRLELLDLEPEIRYVTTKQKGNTANSCREEVEELKGTIKKLEHQISVLEAIDQEIQEKRKPI